LAVIDIGYAISDDKFMDALNEKIVILIDQGLFPGVNSYLREKGKSMPLEMLPYKPGLTLASINVNRSFFLSDKRKAIEHLISRGFMGLYILTGQGLTSMRDLHPEAIIFHHLEEALRWIIEHPLGREAFLQDLHRAAEIIREGGLVAFPTETVYGLGADALNVHAVTRIFEAKGRPLHDPLIVHVSGIEEAERLSTFFSPLARKLAEKFWPGPLTLVVPKAPIVPDLVTAGLPTVAIRMPANPWARKLISLSGTPIAAPSANAFGRTSPTCAEHVREQLEGRYDFLIDGGACRVGVESTVLSLLDNRPVILRPGGVTQEEIEATIGRVEVLTLATKKEGPNRSPGLLASHYAPRTPLTLVSDLSAFSERKDVGFLTLQKPDIKVAGPLIALSPKGDLEEAAANLYRAMRELDQMNLKLIVAQEVPNEGLGAAINDRLKRAARKTK